MLARLPDPARSFALLIGVSTYRHQRLDDLPAVSRNLADLRAALIDPGLGGLPEDRCEIILDPPDGGTVLNVIDDRAKRVEDTFLIYFAGHGLTGPRTGELFLAMSKSRPENPILASLKYGDLRDYFLNSWIYQAKNKVVILDCCYSGRALMSGDVLGMLDISGTYVLTATRGNQAALATSPDGPHTLFTGKLLKILNEGVRGAARLLTLQMIYHELQKAMHEKGYPQPCQLNEETVANLALTQNRAFVPEAGLPASSRPTPAAAAPSEADRVASAHHRTPGPPAAGPDTLSRPARVRLMVGVAAAAIMVATITLSVKFAGNEPGRSTPSSQATVSHQPQRTGPTAKPQSPRVARTSITVRTLRFTVDTVAVTDTATIVAVSIYNNAINSTYIDLDDQVVLIEADGSRHHVDIPASDWGHQLGGGQGFAGTLVFDGRIRAVTQKVTINFPDLDYGSGISLENVALTWSHK